MLICVNYLPNIVLDEKTQTTTSQSRLVVGTPILNRGSAKSMAKLNTFEGDQADLMYGMLVGVDEKGEIKDAEKESKE